MSFLDDAYKTVTGWFSTKDSLDLSKLLGGGAGIAGVLAALNAEDSDRIMSQKQDTTTSGTSVGTSEQNTNQTQTGSQAQTSETTLPQWYLDLVRGQAEGVSDLKKMDPFGKTMLDMDMGAYMNPYLEQVANPVMRRMAEDQALQQQQFDAQRVARGAFGTGRADVLGNQMMERQALERENTLGNMYNQAFGNAQGIAGQDLNRMFQEWQTMQQDPRNLAQTQAGILSTLKPGQITTSTGTTAGTTTGTTTGQTTGTTTGSMTGTTTGSMTGTTTGRTTGQTTGTSSQNMYGVESGTDPNKLAAVSSALGTAAGFFKK
jgi:hypothetical protein